jgi:hypothetical protein
MKLKRKARKISSCERQTTKGSDDMKSKAKKKRKSDASPMEFCCRNLAGGNVWDSLSDLLKSVKLWKVIADDKKEVQEMVQHLFTDIASLHVVSEILTSTGIDARQPPAVSAR